MLEFRDHLLRFVREYQSGVVPFEVLMTRLCMIPKKGDLTVVQNYRPISIISLFLKLVNRLLLNRLRALDPYMRNGQNGFRPHRGTQEHALALRILMERAQSNGLGLSVLFIDSSKAFDSVTFESLRASLKSFCVPSSFIDVVMQCYRNHRIIIPLPGDSVEYVVTSGVLQGCTLAPFLFVLLLDSILDAAMRPELGLPLCAIDVEHTAGGKSAMQLRRRKFDRGKFLTELAYADDLAFVSLSVASNSTQLQAFERIANVCGLYVNTAKGKTEVVNIGVSGDVHSLTSKIGQVSNYLYLGTNPVDSEDLFNRRKGLAWAAIRKNDNLWHCNLVRKSTKRAFFTSLVECIFTYGGVCWPTTVRWRNRIDSTFLRMLKYCVRTSLDEYELFDAGATAHLSSRIAHRRITTVGHALRHNQALADVLMSTLPLPHKGRTRTLEKQLAIDIPYPREDWPLLAADRAWWRSNAARVAQDNENRILLRLLKAKQRRWRDPKRIENRVFLTLLENMDTMPLSSPAAYPFSRLQPSALLRPFHVSRRVAGPFAASALTD
jgi:hypothetical protein